jgi:tetratricopeptide (TPR) repeat protein
LGDFPNYRIARSFFSIKKFKKMANLKIKLKGLDQANFIAGEDQGFQHYQLSKAYSVFSPNRGDVPQQSFEIKADQLIELNFSDDTVWMGDNETLRELFPVEFKRSGGHDELFLPDELTMDAQNRGVIMKIGIKLLKIFSKKAEVFPLVKELAKELENKQLATAGIDFQQVGAGVLLSCSASFDLKKAKIIDSSNLHLLFLHGTGSSTLGSFADLKDTEDWKQIIQYYEPDSILAFQHRTLTASPLENVLELVNSLPDGIQLDLVSHSRGGLVADSLARFCVPNTKSKGFDDTERSALLDHDRKKDIELIEAIEKALKSKTITIRKIVRVACPASGTTLASNRLNLFLNVAFNLLGLASGQIGNPIFISFKELIMATVESKDATDILPGLEAMNPKSPFVQVLNFQGTEIKIEAPLYIVGGSSELSIKWKTLVVLVGKFFFIGKNDLVVDTESMFCGGVRTEGKVSAFIEANGQIDHLKYFITESTLKAIRIALKTDGSVVPRKFELISKSSNAELARGVLGIERGEYKRDQVAGKRPIAVLLPGIMGSNLDVGSNQVWINYFRFLAGQLVRLNYVANKEKVTADSLIGTSYRELGKNLEKTYDVVTFEFDWRSPLPVTAQRLNAKILELLAFKQPIKIIGHSMGGVLVRDFAIYFPDTWQQLNARPGFRTLFLGSPLGGSYRIPYVLFGKDDLIQLLGKIDIKNSTKGLLDIFTNFPGILNLLPINRSGKHDFSDLEFWKKLRTAFGDQSWPIPGQTFLDDFGKYQTKVLAEADRMDYTNVTYIAGQSRKNKFTICDLEIEDSKLVFKATNAGDESVTWESGIPKETLRLKNYFYANATHGGLTTKSKLFAAIDEILVYGKTSKLQNSLPQLRGIEDNFKVDTNHVFDLSESNLRNTILGLGEVGERWLNEMPIQVKVSHGNLIYARYPVLAGHFDGDAILNSEYAIDRELNNEISRLHSLGLYPGLIGTHQIILNRGSEPGDFQGGVIVGLGKTGELSSFQLMNTVEKGISRYLTICNPGENNPNDEPIGISVIAIGNSFGGLSSDSSIRAILLGIQKANKSIATTYKGSKKGIEEVEIIELYHDKALAILKSMKTIEASQNREFNIVFRGSSMESKIGRQWRIPQENSTDWWTRITVSEESGFEVCGESPGGKKMKMSLATTGASERVEYMPSNTKVLDVLLKQMTHNNQFSPEIAKTMFELLIPLQFKEELKRQNNISWVLDLQTAEFPWEMMQEDLQSVPLCINSGMVRQLATQNSRGAISRVSSKSALVIGDPDLDGFMGQLAGARKEGELVTELLRQEKYETQSLIFREASEILVKLFTQNHKIIHLAGHGLFNYGEDKISGMVIGNDTFLLPGQLAGMSEVAELVFVNCCYLGEMDSDVELASQNRNQFAANIGTQLIDNGVRAVIVAGWAVDDTAAYDFAKLFYKFMFTGLGFGESVKRARKKIYEDHGSRSNTWGAFQCYGDPFYKLTDEKPISQDSIGSMLQEEIEIELLNLIHRIETSENDFERILKKVIEIDQLIFKGTEYSVIVLEYLAKLYGSLNLYSDAIRIYKVLMTSNSNGFSVKALEQYCSVRVKDCLILQRSKAVTKDEAIASIMEVLTDLDGLNRFSKTSERWSLIGSAYKRLIVLTDARKAEKMLSSAIEAYEKASKLSNLEDTYPLCNWLQLLQIRNELEGKKGLRNSPIIGRNAMADLLKKLEKNLNQKSSYWDFVPKANILLTQFLITGTATAQRKAIQSYEVLWDKAGTKGQKQEELVHFDCLINSFGNPKIKSELEKKLLEIQKQLVETV